MQTMGGFKGWLIATLVKEFSEEVIEFIEVNLTNIQIKRKVQGTVNNENRNEATSDLNDVFNS